MRALPALPEQADHAGLNPYADENDPEMIARRTNGGLNGYPDRLRWYVRAALVLLGYAPDAAQESQRASNLTIDGISGPRTRAALHSALRKRPELGSVSMPPSPPPSPSNPHPADAVLNRIAAMTGAGQTTVRSRRRYLIA